MGIFFSFAILVCFMELMQEFPILLWMKLTLGLIFGIVSYFLHRFIIRWSPFLIFGLSFIVAVVVAITFLISRPSNKQSTIRSLFQIILTGFQGSIPFLISYTLGNAVMIQVGW